MVINIYEAKTNMSKLLHLLESGQEKEIIVCNRGKPVLRWLPILDFPNEKRPFGIWKDKYQTKEENDFFALDDEIAREFEGD